MMDSQPRPTTKSSQMGERRSRWGKRHPAWLGSALPEMVGRQFGRVVIVSSKIKRVNGYIRLRCRCLTCGKVKWILKDNLKKQDGCQSCSQRKSIHQPVLGRRYDAIIARCNNPKNPAYKHYGGRGIECLFSSRADFVSWVERNLPHKDYRGVEIDRRDNDGHYAPGNLRLATRREQMLNKRDTAKMLFRGQLITVDEFESPYERSWTGRLVRRGMTGEQIIQHAVKHAQQEKVKNWRHLQLWLAFRGYMTLPTLDLDADSLSRGG